MPDTRKPYSKPEFKRLERTPETEHIFKQLEKENLINRARQNDNPETEEKPGDSSESE
jgi:hypothetical protein